MLNYISGLPSAVFAETWPRKIALFGSTGSIGRAALDVLERSAGYFTLTALAGGRNMRLLAEQALRLRPPCLAALDERAAGELRILLRAVPDYHPEILSGPGGYAAMAAQVEADVVLSAQAGAAGLRATYAAVKAGRVVALANKESLVLAGDILRRECRLGGASILPVDSEHNAVFQCLSGQQTRSLPERLQALPPRDAKGNAPNSSLRRLILTASGGPFLHRDPASLARITPQEALAHPTWNMGAKISIDSATMMNKGMEYVEACRLFGLRPDQVEVLIHPQSVIHSLVEFKDASRLAQLGTPDMRIPISHCLGWPYRLDSGAAELNLAAVPALSFFEPDASAFPALGYWRDALAGGRGLTVALNAANEVAVALFLSGKIAFTQITGLAAMTLEQWHESSAPNDIETVLALDEQARALAREQAARLR
ncbi:MAG: 1-deoxy-D-xylulose-5-phosphate reductoisomerase [Deltaproteobacteria bacterium]|jgi:1-deoxy-D-xylulose-5-phosphate reductoisomerase|nr:1-deoxy-D-xylulose-5-phosphate reductoisomerase [Deltaproteobacteria bacterium]